MVSFLQWPLSRSSDGSKKKLLQGTSDGLDFLQPGQCAYADDLAVAALSFRGVMTALAPAFRFVVLTWWVFTPSALRLAIELQHARPRSAKAMTKSNGPWAHLHSYFCSPIWEKEFLAPSMTFSTANAFDFSVAWTMMASLMKFRRIKSRRLLLGFL